MGCVAFLVPNSVEEAGVPYQVTHNCFQYVKNVIYKLYSVFAYVLTITTVKGKDEDECAVESTDLDDSKARDSQLLRYVVKIADLVWCDVCAS